MRPHFLKRNAGEVNLRCWEWSWSTAQTFPCPCRTVVLLGSFSIFLCLFLDQQPSSGLKGLSDRVEQDWRLMGKDINFRNGSWKHMSKTKIFPFRTGCPEGCSNLRAVAALKLEDTYFRTGTLWRLSGRHLQNASLIEQKIRAESVPRDFGTSFDLVESEIMREVQELPFALEHVMFYHQQKSMHLSLSYDCCWTEEEVQNFKLVFRRWLGQTRFNLHLHFTHLECWLERFNSLTIIAVVDSAAQRELLRWNHQLNELLRSHGIPVLVQREDQMPFHMTVLGIYLGSEFSPLPRDHMELFGEAICEKVTEVSQAHGTLGTSATEPVVLNFVPEFSSSDRRTHSRHTQIRKKPNFGCDMDVEVFAASTVFSAAAGLFIFTLQGRVSATLSRIILGPPKLPVCATSWPQPYCPWWFSLRPGTIWAGWRFWATASPP
eukprot:s282_g18.t4